MHSKAMTDHTIIVALMFLGLLLYEVKRMHHPHLYQLIATTRVFHWLYARITKMYWIYVMVDVDALAV